jgi:hypothetical protein
VDKQIETLELHKQTYPRDYRAAANLSDVHLRTAQFNKAADAAREAMRLNPNAAVLSTNLGVERLAVLRCSVVVARTLLPVRKRGVHGSGFDSN